VSLNCYDHLRHLPENGERKDEKIKIKYTLFPLKSLINHNRESNVKVEFVYSDIIFIFAAEDIEQG
jgi:hypothetical protein